ncbi:hypothetical protein [Verrucosispora sp. NA02020]|uniref:hypothetical protein n=1 Tax=Verrucosispora sp. NA02020 TaxID=2742132 RepID=UPI003D71BDDE
MPSDLTDDQRRHLLGDDDTPGLLDEYKVITYIPRDGKPVVAWFCPRQHGDSVGHVGLIARDLDGDQTGLTLAELVTAALDHEAESH